MKCQIHLSKFQKLLSKLLKDWISFCPRIIYRIRSKKLRNENCKIISKFKIKVRLLNFLAFMEIGKKLNQIWATNYQKYFHLQDWPLVLNYFWRLKTFFIILSSRNLNNLKLLFILEIFKRLRLQLETIQGKKIF